MVAVKQKSEVQTAAPSSVMTPLQFVKKWGEGTPAHEQNEVQASHQHFIELCGILGVPAPLNDRDVYTFEKGCPALNGTLKFADVWKQGCFAWEYKRPGKNLEDALDQLRRYSDLLDNPPLLVVTDRTRYELHAHFTGYPTRRVLFAHSQLLDPQIRAQLRAAFVDPYSFKPSQDVKRLTEEVAATFASIADALRDARVTPQQTAHFLCQCIFCYFAEDIGLMNDRSFKRSVTTSDGPDELREQLTELFKKMQKGGKFGADRIPWFNGGLFNTIDVPVLPEMAVETLAQVADADWSAIDPGILGTLFERGLDPNKRSQLGAFYTNPGIIERLVVPVVQAPLMREWDQRAREINGLLSSRDVKHIEAEYTKSSAKRSRIRSKGNVSAKKAQDLFDTFLDRLANYRVLDPACGSGNFLYLALKAIKDVEKQVHADADRLGLGWQFAVTGVQNVMGIEANDYAAELARITVWIGELQWRKNNGYGWSTNPILKKLDHIECRDAILERDALGTYVETSWPDADVIVGNPPFVGNKSMREKLGQEYTEALRRTYDGVLSGGVDFVCYWFHKALHAVDVGSAAAAGLVCTQAVRKGTNRQVLDAICARSSIFEAWSNEPWVNEGAAVRVSLVCFGKSGTASTILDGVEVQRIAADLTGMADVDMTQAVPLQENSGFAFQGPVKVGKFDVPGEMAREWLALPNINGRPNSDVLRPWANGQDIAGRSSDTWIVDFGVDMSDANACEYEKPFAHVRTHVKPMRLAGNRAARKKYWWLHGETVPGLRKRLQGLGRYLVTPRVAKHRYFVWLPIQVWPDSRLFVIARDDDFTFGVLSSRLHTVWSIAAGSNHGAGNDPTYNGGSCFEAFPFPEGVEKELAQRIEACAAELDSARSAWLNPPDWTMQVPEVRPLGMKRSPYPPRLVAKRGFESRLAERTMTKLYNEAPPWLEKVQRALDHSVAAAYGWGDYTPDLPDEEILRRLMELNAQRSAANSSG